MLAQSESNPPRRRPPYGIYAYTAREWDPEINLYYYRARYYDPKIGRFISEDPIGFDGGTGSLSLYAANSPTFSSDPYGLCPKRLDAGWETKTIGPRGATDDAYRAETKERTVLYLWEKQGDCCREATIICVYLRVANFMRRTRTFDDGEFGPWSRWKISPYNVIGVVWAAYDCETGRVIDFVHQEPANKFKR